MDDLGLLMRDMANCQACTDLPLGPRPLFQLGKTAKILIAGQAPGRITHHKGRPFDDPSGDRLRAWMGIDRDTFYDPSQIAILPMGLCFPGSGKGGDAPPRPECAPLWRDKALALLPDLAITLVIGRYAINWHLPHLKGASVADAVGQSAASDGPIVMPHPSPRNNRWLRQNPWFAADVLPRVQGRIAAQLGAG